MQRANCRLISWHSLAQFCLMGALFSGIASAQLTLKISGPNNNRALRFFYQPGETGSKSGTITISGVSSFSFSPAQSDWLTVSRDSSNQFVLNVTVTNNGMPKGEYFKLITITAGWGTPTAPVPLQNIPTISKTTRARGTQIFPFPQLY